MSKRGRLIPFHHKVPNPGEAVSDHRPQQRIPGMTQRKRRNRYANSEQRSAQMQNAISGMAVSPQVEGEKFFVAPEFWCAHKSGLYPDRFIFDQIRDSRQCALKRIESQAETSIWGL